MWIAALRALGRLACALVVTLVVVTLAFAAVSLPPSQQFRASADAPVYIPTYMRLIEQEKSERSRVVDKKFVSMSALVMGLTIADIESTQHCLGNGTCRELNPMMPRSHVGMYAVNIPINAVAMYVSYRLKASGHKTWWIAPLTISGAHGVGAGFVF